MSDRVKKFVSALTLSFVLFSGALAYGASGCTDIQVQSLGDVLRRVACGAGYIQGNDTRAINQQTVSEIVGNILNVIFSLTGLIFVGLTVYGGFLWMTARGNSQQVEDAEKLLRNSIIGILVTFAAFSISFFVLWGISQTGL